MSNNNASLDTPIQIMQSLYVLPWLTIMCDILQLLLFEKMPTVFLFAILVSYVLLSFPILGK